MSFHRLRTFMQSPEAEDFTEVLALQISPESGCHLDQLLTPRRVSGLTRDDIGIVFLRLVDKDSLGSPVSLSNSTMTDLFVLESVTTASLILVKVLYVDLDIQVSSSVEPPPCEEPEFKEKQRVLVNRAAKGYLWAVSKDYFKHFRPDLVSNIPLISFQLLDVRGSLVVDEPIPTINLMNDFSGVVSPHQDLSPHHLAVNVSDRVTTFNQTNSKFIELVHGFNPNVRGVLGRGGLNYFDNVKNYFFPPSWVRNIPLLGNSDWLRGFYLGGFDTAFTRPSVTSKDKNDKFFLCDFAPEGKLLRASDVLVACTNIGVVMDLVAQADVCIANKFNDISYNGWGRLFKNVVDSVSNHSFGTYYTLNDFHVKFVQCRIASSLAAFFGSFFLPTNWSDCQDKDLSHIRAQAAVYLQVDLASWPQDWDSWSKIEAAAANVKKARDREDAVVSPRNTKKPKQGANKSPAKKERTGDDSYEGPLFCLHELLFILNLGKPSGCQTAHAFEHLSRAQILSQKEEVIKWADARVKSPTIHSSLVAAVRALSNSG